MTQRRRWRWLLRESVKVFVMLCQCFMNSSEILYYVPGRQIQKYWKKIYTKQEIKNKAADKNFRIQSECSQWPYTIYIWVFTSEKCKMAGFYSDEIYSNKMPYIYGTKLIACEIKCKPVLNNKCIAVQTTNIPYNNNVATYTRYQSWIVQTYQRCHCMIHPESNCINVMDELLYCLV